MINWFHHDPARGRVGPLTTEELLQRYRTRVLQADSLVWHDQLREWQPLEKALAEQDVALGPQDQSLPPPLPNSVAGPAYTTPMPGRPAAPARPQRKGMHGCLIALLIGAGLSIPLFAILAAIALPAYRDYTIKAKVYSAIAESMPVREALTAHVDQQGTCPTGNEPGFDDPSLYSTQMIQGVEFGEAEDGACTYTILLRNIAEQVDGETAVFALRSQGEQYVYDYECAAGTVPDIYEPSECRGTRGDTP